MNTVTENGKTTKTDPSVLAGDLIRTEIEKQPKMSAKVAAQVARNFDGLLRHLKEHGISMHAVCRAAALGNPDDRDSKALYKYRNPEGSKPRNYITNAPKFIKLAEAIAEIGDHPYSGTSSQVLSRIFSGTPYLEAFSQCSEASITLKTILDEVTSWIVRQVDVVQAYRVLLLPKKQFDTEYQFDKLQVNPPLHFELGYRKTVIKDKEGLPIVLQNESGDPFELAVTEDVSFFIGVDRDTVPRPFLGFKKSLGAFPTEEGGDIWLKWHTNFDQLAEPYVRILGLEDGPRAENEIGEIIYHSSVGELRLADEIVSRSVDLDLLAEFTEFPDITYIAGKPLVSAFLAGNDEYSATGVALGLESEMFSGPQYRTMPVSADTLEYLEKLLSEPEGVFLPLGRFYSSTGSSLYGHGALGRLIRCFTTEPLSYKPNEIESNLLKLEPIKYDLREDEAPIIERLARSPMAPSGGWINATYRLGGLEWSAADVLWLRTKMLVMAAKTKAAKETEEIQSGIDTLLRRLKSMQQ